MAECVKKNTHLRSLDLGANQGGVDGVKALLQVLPSSGLETVDLRHNAGGGCLSEVAAIFPKCAKLNLLEYVVKTVDFHIHRTSCCYPSRSMRYNCLRPSAETRKLLLAAVKSRNGRRLLYDAMELQK